MLAWIPLILLFETRQLYAETKRRTEEQNLQEQRRERTEYHFGSSREKVSVLVK